MTAFEKFSAVFRYDETTGRLFWKQRGKGRQSAKPVGNKNDQGYWIVMFEGSNYRAARIVWLLNTGAWPVNEIDHIDRNRANDKFENLRDVTRSENMLNTNVHADAAVPYKGIYINNRGKYVARKQNRYLGSFLTLDQARSAYDKA